MPARIMQMNNRITMYKVAYETAMY